MSLSSHSESIVESSRPRRTRIDPPHPVEEAGDSAAPTALLEVIDEPSPELIAAITGQSLESRREQLQLQVSQLAGHLRERLREVDRREAQVNARAGQLEADIRANRMWMREREHEFQERETELRRQIEELQERLAPQQSAPGANGAAGDEPEPYTIEARQQELAEREHELRMKGDELRERRFEVERQAAALRHAQQLWEQQRGREEQELVQSRERLTQEFAQQINQREADLLAAEAMLIDHSAQLEKDRQALAAERQAWESQRLRQGQSLAERQQRLNADAADRAQSLDARQDWIERQKHSLEQTRGEIASLHRQSLEMRLIAEQLWSQIGGRLAASEVTHAIAQTRIRLAEQYKLEEQALDEKREQLIALGERMAAQHAEFKQLQSGLRDWNDSRQAEIEHQAQALVERELALDAEQTRLRASQEQWQAERRQYEQQLRDLSAKLRTQAAA